MNEACVPNSTAVSDHAEKQDEEENNLQSYLGKIKICMNRLNSETDIFGEAVKNELKQIQKFYLTGKKLGLDVLKLFAKCLVDEHISLFYVRLWTSFNKDIEAYFEDLNSDPVNILISMQSILWNFSDRCVVIAKDVYHNNVIKYLMQALTLPQLSVDKLKVTRLRHIVKGVFGILHNCIRNFSENKYLVRENNGLDTLLKYNKSTYLIVKAKVIIVMSYCVDEEENDKLVTGCGVIKFIVELLTSALEGENHVSKTYSFSAYETVEALNNIASNDGNKRLILDADILPMLIRMLDRDNFNKEEVRSAVNCIWTLSFHPNNTIQNEKGLIEIIEKLAKEANDKETEKACHGLLFVLKKQPPEKVDAISKDEGKTKAHQIMISERRQAGVDNAQFRLLPKWLC